MATGFTTDMKLNKGTKLFLDRKSCQNTTKIEKVLKKIGIIVDEFLSKDVDYIVTDNMASRCNLQNQSEKNLIQEGVQKSIMSRSQALLMRTSTSVNSQSSTLRTDPVHFALKFEIPLVTTADLKRILHCKMAGLKNLKNNSDKDSHLMKLDTNFIKVEDCSQCFIPLFKKFLSLSPKETKNNNCSKKLPKKNLTKENLGYCEICDEICDDLTMHRKTRKHLSFASDSKNFSSIDKLIEGLSPLSHLKNLHEDGIACSLLEDGDNNPGTEWTKNEAGTMDCTTSFQNVFELDVNKTAVVRPWEALIPPNKNVPNHPPPMEHCKFSTPHKPALPNHNSALHQNNFKFSSNIQDNHKNLPLWMANESLAHSVDSTGL